MELVGCDVFLYSEGGAMPDVPKQIGSLKLELMSNRGTKVWPATAARLDYYADEWRCRFTSEGDKPVKRGDVDAVVRAIMETGKPWTRIQALHLAKDGSRAFSSPY